MLVRGKERGRESDLSMVVVRGGDMGVVFWWWFTGQREIKREGEGGTVGFVVAVTQGAEVAVVVGRRVEGREPKGEKQGRDTEKGDKGRGLGAVSCGEVNDNDGEVGRQWSSGRRRLGEATVVGDWARQNKEGEYRT